MLTELTIKEIGADGRAEPRDWPLLGRFTIGNFTLSYVFLSDWEILDGFELCRI
jgi:hypothetical protein